jgi:hypothetical protein
MRLAARGEVADAMLRAAGEPRFAPVSRTCWLSFRTRFSQRAACAGIRPRRPESYCKLLCATHRETAAFRPHGTPMHRRQRHALATGTLPHCFHPAAALATNAPPVPVRSPGIPVGSGTRSKIASRSRRILEKIIGHGSGLLRPRIPGGDHLWLARARRDIHRHLGRPLVLLSRKRQAKPAAATKFVRTWRSPCRQSR